MQLNLLRLYKDLHHTWLKNIQFFIITHSIYFIGEFVNDDDAVVYNFNNYKPLKCDEKGGLLISYNINGSFYSSWDEITYLIDQIPTFNVYYNLYEILNVHANKKYKIDIKKYNEEKTEYHFVRNALGRKTKITLMVLNILLIKNITTFFQKN